MTKESTKLLKLKLNDFNIHEEIYPIYMPREFIEFKEEVLSLNYNKEKYFTKIEHLGPKLIENFPNILDFNLSSNALEGEVPWLYVLGKNIDMEYIGDKMIYLITNTIRSKGEDAEDFLYLPSCDNLYNALENLSLGEKLSHEEILSRKRLIEGIIAHRLASKDSIKLELNKVFSKYRADLIKFHITDKDKAELEEEWLKIESLLSEKDRGNLKKNWQKISTLLPEDLKTVINTDMFDFERFIPEELKSSISNKWKLLDTLTKEVKFFTCFDYGKHTVISQPITHNPQESNPVYSSYIISFSVETEPLCDTQELQITINRRVWMNKKFFTAIKKKQSRKHSLYIYNGDKSVSRYVFKYNKSKDNLIFANKVENDLLEKRQIDINKIVEDPSEFQKANMSTFMAVPYDAQVFSSRPRQAGIGNMEKLALREAISRAVELKEVDDKDLLLVKRNKGDISFSFTSNKDIHLQIWEQTDNFFDDIEKGLYTLKQDAIKKKSTDEIFYYLGDINREDDEINTTLNLQNKTINLTITRHYCGSFSKIDLKQESSLDVYNLIQEELKSTYNPENLTVAIVELEDLSSNKNSDPKEIIKAAFSDNNIPTQMITPMSNKPGKEVTDLSRIASSICDALFSLGITKQNELINNGIVQYTYKEYKVNLPKSITNLSSNEDFKKTLSITIPVLLKSESGYRYLKVLDTKYNWVSFQGELFIQIQNHISSILNSIQEYLNCERGLKKFSTILDFVIKDNVSNTSKRKILTIDYGAERESFNEIYSNYIQMHKDMAINNNVELIFTKNNNTPQFITVCKEETVYIHKEDKLISSTLANTETTHRAGYIKCSDNLVYLIGDKPSTYKPNKTDNSFEHDKIEARRKMLELIYFGDRNIDDIAIWYQLNRNLHISYSVMTNRHIDGHILEKFSELIDIIEYKYMVIYKLGEEEEDNDEILDNLESIEIEIDNINIFNTLIDNSFEKIQVSEQLSLF